LPFDPVLSTCLVKFLKVVMFFVGLQFQHLNWFYFFRLCIHFFNLNYRPTRCAYCRKYIYERPIEGHGKIQTCKEQLLVLKQNDLVQMSLCRMPTKQRNIKASINSLSPIPTAQVTIWKRKAQVDSVQTVQKLSHECLPWIRHIFKLHLHLSWL